VTRFFKPNTTSQNQNELSIHLILIKKIRPHVSGHGEKMIYLFSAKQKRTKPLHRYQGNRLQTQQKIYTHIEAQVK